MFGPFSRSRSAAAAESGPASRMARSRSSVILSSFSFSADLSKDEEDDVVARSESVMKRVKSSLLVCPDPEDAREEGGEKAT